MSLSILVVTAYGRHSCPFLDESERLAERLGAGYVEHDGRDAGALEHALDDAVAACPDGYVLRLDDDEKVSPELEDWLATGGYLEATHWSFPRLNLYPDANSYIISHHLYPDVQTRLSVKAMAGGRMRIHQGSPYGGGRLCPHPLEHHKFLVRSKTERRALLSTYESLQPGAGENFVAFSLPESLNGLAFAPRRPKLVSV